MKLATSSVALGHAAKSSAIVIASALLAASAGAAAPGNTAPDDPNDWPEYHRDYRGWRFSTLEGINKSNVNELKVAWIHQPGEITSGLLSQPIIVQGVLYYSASNNRTFALDAATGEELWRYVPELDPVQERSLFGFYNRGVSVGRGKVFLGRADGRIEALDQKTGKSVWQAQLTVPEKCHGCNFNSPPVLAGNILIAGPTGGDLAQRSPGIFALDADTGERLWTFDVIKDDPKSWPGDSAKVAGGGAWLPGQYDPTTDTFYIGTSNPAPDLNIHNRKGDNLYTSTILALDPKTGKIKWHHQEIPNDAWDLDSSYEFVYIDQGGKELMIHLNKGGFVTVIDRKTGKLHDIWRFAHELNWVEKIDRKTGKLIGRRNPQVGVSDVFCPSTLGARSWNAGAYSPQTNLWYTNAYEICHRAKVSVQPIDTLAFSQPYYDASEFEVIPPPGKAATARLSAYDPLTGKEAWRVEYEVPGLAHVLATAGGLVFNGDPRGWIHAYDDRTGRELWKFNAGSGLRGGLASYAVNGKQFIAAATGFGSLLPGFASIPWSEFKDVRGGAALIVFTLDE